MSCIFQFLCTKYTFLYIQWILETKVQSTLRPHSLILLHSLVIATQPHISLVPRPPHPIVLVENPVQHLEKLIPTDYYEQ